MRETWGFFHKDTNTICEGFDLMTYSSPRDPTSECITLGVKDFNGQILSKTHKFSSAFSNCLETDSTPTHQPREAGGSQG